MRHPFCSPGRAFAWLALAGALALNAGCVSTKWFHQKDKDEPPEVGDPCRVVTWWLPHVVHAPDPTRGGTPTPGFAGRLYLFGQEIGTPLVSPGGLAVCLYDETCLPEGAEPVAQEIWYIDAATLKRCLKKDRIGWGYSLFLPWSKYHPGVTRVVLRIYFEKPDGARIFQESDSRLNLGEDTGVVTSEKKSHPLTAPGAAAPAAPAGPVAAPAAEPAAVNPLGGEQPARPSATVIPSGHPPSGLTQTGYTTASPPVLGRSARPPMLGTPARPLAGPNPKLPIR